MMAVVVGVLGDGGDGLMIYAQPQVTTTTSTATQTTEVGQQQQQPAAVHTPKPYRWEEERAELKVRLFHRTARE